MNGSCVWVWVSVGVSNDGWLDGWVGSCAGGCLG